MPVKTLKWNSEINCITLVDTLASIVIKYTMELHVIARCLLDTQRDYIFPGIYLKDIFCSPKKGPEETKIDLCGIGIFAVLKCYKV